MKYEELIAKAQSHTPELPEMPEPREAGKLPWDRRTKIVAACLAVILYGYLGIWVDSLMHSSIVHSEALVGLLAPLAVTLATFALFRRATFRAQLVLRGLLWSNLVIGLLLAVFIALPAAGTGGALVGMGSALALVALSRVSLSDLDDPTFRPVAYSGRLVAALALAMADAHTLLFSALGQTLAQSNVAWHALRSSEVTIGWDKVMLALGPAWLAAVLMGVAVWGLVRLRVWALLLNMVLNFVIAGLAMNGVLGVSVPVAMSLTVTAALQLLIIVPILAAALGQAPRAERSFKVLTLGAALMLAVFSATGIIRARPFAKHQWAEKRALVRGQTVGPAKGQIRGAPVFSNDTRSAARFEGRYCDLNGADWSGQDWSGIDERTSLHLNRCEAAGLDASAADWTWARLTQTNLEDANLDGLVAPHSSWWGNDLGGASFQQADLRDAQFLGEPLIGADFQGADLRGAEVLRIRVVDVSFRDANLRDAHFENVVFENVDWSGATCPDASLASEHGDTCEGEWLERPVLPPRGYTGWIEIDGTRRRAWLVVGGPGELDGASVAGIYVRPGEMRLAWERGDARRALLFPWLTVDAARVDSVLLAPRAGEWVVDRVSDEGLELHDDGRLEGSVLGREVNLQRRTRLGFFLRQPARP